jgi:hypothetical protein
MLRALLDSWTAGQPDSLKSPKISQNPLNSHKTFGDFV